MTEEFTVERLRKWGEDLNAESNGLGAHLLRYAEAWEEERNTLMCEILERLDNCSCNCRGEDD